MSWRLIESDQALEDLLASISDSEAVALDTEFMRRNTFYPQVALLQLYVETPGAGENIAWLVDPLQIEDTSGLQELLASPSIVKVLHSASEDLEVFSRWLGVMPRPLFDTQKAAALLGIGFGMGYRALVHELESVDLPKGETRSDWLQRPLSQAQCEYAAMDVSHLWALWQKLGDLAKEQGKWDWIIADGENAVAAQQSGSNLYYPRVKGARKLDRRQLGALAAICAWREATARERDKPRGWIIDDQACLRLAQGDLRTMEDLRSRADLPAPVLRRYGKVLLDVLAQNRCAAEFSLPPALPPPLVPAQRSAVKELKGFIRELGESLNVAPEALLQSKDYELLIRQAAGEAIEQPGHWRGWRREVVLEPLQRDHFGSSA